MGIELVWPSACLVVSMILIVAEAFVPSGGLIGLLAVGFLIVSLYLAFATTSAGWIFVAVAGLLLPLSIALWAYLWPKTPVAKYLFLQPPEREDVIPDSHGLVLEHLVGQFGRTLTPLRPTGTVDFDGRRLEGMSEEGLIPSNTLVRAIRTRSGRLIVRVADVSALGDVTATYEPA